MLKTVLIITISFFTLYSFDITPIPDVKYNKQKALLGQKLFFDVNLSSDKSVACVSCHNLPGSGAQNIKFSFGVDAQEGDVNSPTVLNSYFNFSQFFDGRAKDLFDQVKGPITNPIEMNNTIKNVLNYLKNSKEYKKSFKKIYKKIDKYALYDAISEFEKALTTPDSKFDRYLKGLTKLSSQELKGYSLFKSYGCISCHNGVNIGSNMYQKMGVFTSEQNFKNLGRYNVTKDIDDKYFYKVPTLRNISKTAPYFHNGSASTLKDAISTMASNQLGINLDDDEIELLESFLKTLDGKSPRILDEL